MSSCSERAGDDDGYSSPDTNDNDPVDFILSRQKWADQNYRSMERLEGRGGPSSPPASRSQEEMTKKKSVSSLKEADLKGKKVLTRIDLDVPLDDNLHITDNSRLRAALPTIRYLITHGARVILCSHLRRPNRVTPRYSLKSLVPKLSELLEVEVKMANDCIGEEVKKRVAELPNEGVLLLENVMFYEEENKNDPAFAESLASLADLYVNDAFYTAQAQASTEGVTKYLKPAVAGFLLQKELDYLVGVVSNPKRPFAAIIGGWPLSFMTDLIEPLLAKVDLLLLGKMVILPFYKAQGYKVGLVGAKDYEVNLATSLLEKAKARGVCLMLPTDVVIADKLTADADSEIVPASAIPDDALVFDIGPDSIKAFGEALDSSQTIIWDGPMGSYEIPKFAAGTEAIARKLAELGGKGVTTIIVGDESVAAVEKYGLADKMSHISTGDTVARAVLRGNTLPAVLALDDV